jgi:hypothetical protein
MNRILHWLYQRHLQKRLRQLKRRMNSVNVENAKTVGILFDATNPETRQAIISYAKLWKKKGKKVLLLGFFNAKTGNEELPFPSFNRKGLDWMKRPKNQACDEFLKAPLDLLILPCQHPLQPLTYITALHPAPLKVGTAHPLSSPYLDLMVDTGENQSLDFLLKQINVYLKLINNES